MPLDVLICTTSLRISLKWLGNSVLAVQGLWLACRAQARSASDGEWCVLEKDVE